MNRVCKTKAIRIPPKTTLLYCQKKNLLVFIGERDTKSVKPNVRVFFSQTKQNLIVTRTPVSPISKNLTKKLKGWQGQTASQLHQKLLEVRISFYLRIRLVGVGYRTLMEDPTKSGQAFRLKLGYTHMLYCVLPNNLHLFCFKYTRMTLYGAVTFQNLTLVASKIRKNRSPDPYKGKGVLYSNEKISLKIGKRV